MTAPGMMYPLEDSLPSPVFTFPVTLSYKIVAEPNKEGHKNINSTKNPTYTKVVTLPRSIQNEFQLGFHFQSRSNSTSASPRAKLKSKHNFEIKALFILKTTPLYEHKTQSILSVISQDQLYSQGLFCARKWSIILYGSLDMTYIEARSNGFLKEPQIGNDVKFLYSGGN